MPAPVIAAIIGAGAAVGGTAYSVHASNSAEKKRLTSANYAADIQSQTADKTLQFQKDEAARARADAEVTRHANYDQWAADQRRRGTLGQLLGLGAPEIPGYVPLGDGTLGSAMPSGPAAGAPQTPAGTQSVPGGDYQQWFNSLVAGKPFTQKTLLDLEPTLNAAGVKLTPPNAAGDRTKIGLPNGQWVRVGFGEGKPVWVVQPSATAMTPRTAAAGTLGAMMPSATPYASAPLTPALQAPQFQYPYGSLGGYLGG